MTSSGNSSCTRSARSNCSSRSKGLWALTLLCTVWGAAWEGRSRTYLPTRVHQWRNKWVHPDARGLPTGVEEEWIMMVMNRSDDDLVIKLIVLIITPLVSLPRCLLAQLYLWWRTPTSKPFSLLGWGQWGFVWSPPLSSVLPVSQYHCSHAPSLTLWICLRAPVSTVWIRSAILVGDVSRKSRHPNCHWSVAVCPLGVRKRFSWWTRVSWNRPCWCTTITSKFALGNPPVLN